MSRFLQFGGCADDDDEDLPGSVIDDVDVTYSSRYGPPAPAPADPLSLAVRHLVSEVQRVAIPEWFGASEAWELMGAEAGDKLRVAGGRA